MQHHEEIIVSPCTAHIDISAIQHNYKRLLASIPQGTQGMAVVKNDAYGHGLLQVAKGLDDIGVHSFGVGTIHEALALRKAGFKQDILILLGVLNAEEMRLAAEHDILPVVYNEAGLQYALAQNTSMRIALKIETGMSRLGFHPVDMGYILEFFRNNQEKIKVDLVLSHFACADMPEKESMVMEQSEMLHAMSNALQNVFPNLRRSTSNSAGSLAYGHLGGNIFRFGVALYGGNPFCGTIWEFKGDNLKEAMSVSTPILHIQEVQAGQSIGYGATFIAEKDMSIATLGIGYADGLSRGLSSRGIVCVNGQSAPICGRVCMGMTMVDISHIAGVEIGQKAWIATAQDNRFSMQSLADSWGTIIHEPLCLLGRNTRIYI